MAFQPIALVGGFESSAAFLVLIGMASTVFWMVVGWRAMRAHERIASSTEALAARGPRSEGGA